MSWKTNAVEVKDDWRKNATIVTDPDVGKTVGEGTQSMFDPDVLAETAADNAVVAGQTFALNAADEIAGTIAGVASDPLFNDVSKVRRNYEETRDAVRSRVRQARENSPKSTLATEMLTPSALDAASLGMTKMGGLASKFTKGSRGLESLMMAAPVEGAAYGFFGGETPEERKNLALMGTGMGSLGSIAMGALKYPFKDPRQVRQRALGGAVREFEERGFKNPEKIDEAMEKTGLFKNPSFLKDFDPVERKYIAGKNPKPSRSMRQTEVIFSNLETGKSRLNDYNNQILKRADERFIPTSIDDVIGDISETGGSGISELWRKARVDPEIRDELQKAISHISSDEPLKISEIKKFKDYMQQTGRDSFTTRDKPSPKSIVYGELSRDFNDWLENALNYSDKNAGSVFRENNKVMSSMITQSDMLANRIARQKGLPVGAPVNIGVGPTYMASKVTEKAGMSTPAAMLRSKVGLATKKVVPEMVDDMLKTAATKTLLPNYIGDEQQNEFMNKYTSMPEMIIKTPIPRDSKSILANKEFVLEKIRMQMPMMYENVADVLNNSPNKIPEILPIIIQAAPSMFETDEYNRVDGKILNPVDISRAVEDTIKDAEMSNTEKVARLNNLSTKGML